MTSEPQIQAFGCPVDEISAYIDGELAAARELELEAHFVGCRACADELNLQKQFLLGLNSSLKCESELELPANFTRNIVVNAESTVAGLRRPRELYNAAFICAALFLFVLFGLGADAGRVLYAVSTTLEQAAAVGGFFGHLVYSFLLGVAIILRSLASQVTVDGLAAMTLFVVAAGFLTLLSHKVLRIRRV